MRSHSESSADSLAGGKHQTPSVRLPVKMESSAADQRLTREDLIEYLSYNENSGVFTWRKQSGPRAKIGRTAGTVHATYKYITIQFRGKFHKAHRLAWLYTYGVWPTGEIDHKNHDRTDNRICNLRDGTKSQNQGNRIQASSHSYSKIIGAHWNSVRKFWFSQIGVNGKNKHLGVYKTPELAHIAYVKAKRRLHEFCEL